MAVTSKADVDAWLAKVPQPARAALQVLRQQIRSAAPKAEEGIGYGQAGFYQDGPVFYYGAGKNHCALYGTRPAGFEDALKDYVTSKGTVRFTVDKPLPPGLVKKLVKAKLAENKARQSS